MQEEELFENLMQVLWEYASSVKELYKGRLLADNKKATGALINSVDTFVVFQGTEFLVTLKVEDYYRWVEEGRKPGKFPPVDKILDWIKAKPVLPYPGKNGKLPTENQLAYLIGRKIATEGIEPGHQLSDVLEGLNRKYIPLLQEALNKDFDRYAISIFNKINKLVKI